MSNKPVEEMISAYVDGELGKQEEHELLQLARSDERIRRAIDSERKLKNLIKTRLRPKPVPDHLRLKIQKLVSIESIRESSGPVQEPSGKTRLPGFRFSSRNRYLLSIAAILLIGVMYMLISQNPAADAVNSTDVEFITYQHFLNLDGTNPGTIPEGLNTAGVQQMLSDQYSTNIRVPELAGAVFGGMAYPDFFEGYETPLLTYQTPDDQFIYLFAFELDKLGGHPSLELHKEASEQIVNHDDVYISEYNGKHVVSWKWHNVWYCAVSNHNGETVAAMLPH